MELEKVADLACIGLDHGGAVNVVIKWGVVLGLMIGQDFGLIEQQVQLIGIELLRTGSEALVSGQLNGLDQLFDKVGLVREF